MEWATTTRVKSNPCTQYKHTCMFTLNEINIVFIWRFEQSKRAETKHNYQTLSMKTLIYVTTLYTPYKAFQICVYIFLHKCLILFVLHISILYPTNKLRLNVCSGTTSLQHNLLYNRCTILMTVFVSCTYQTVYFSYHFFVQK